MTNLINVREISENNTDIIVQPFDILFVLTIGNTELKKNTTHLIIKIIVFREVVKINLSAVSKRLKLMNIDELNIFSVDMSKDKKNKSTRLGEYSPLNYIDIDINTFLEILENEDNNFQFFNKNSLYIFRNCQYKDIKGLLTNIKGHKVSIVRGANQKSHVLSPLDFRLSCYLLAMFNFSFKYIMFINSFNDLSKDMYLFNYEEEEKST